MRASIKLNSKTCNVSYTQTYKHHRSPGSIALSEEVEMHFGVRGGNPEALGGSKSNE
jgi:hypothetical protein